MSDANRNRAHTLTILEPLVGVWIEELDLADTPPGRTTFEWGLDGQFLIQRSEVADPNVPDSLAIIAVAAEGSGYTQHYFDSRGVVRIYAMTFDGQHWTLQRTEPDFTPLTFAQRFTATFSADGNTIDAMWETTEDSATWRKDFDLAYTRIAVP
jgi:hypothetical protein